MAIIAPYYATDPTDRPELGEVYHDCDDCKVGQSIDADRRVDGNAGRARCPECAARTQEAERNYGYQGAPLEISVVRGADGPVELFAVSANDQQLWWSCSDPQSGWSSPQPLPAAPDSIPLIGRPRVGLAGPSPVVFVRGDDHQIYVGRMRAGAKSDPSAWEWLASSAGGGPWPFDPAIGSFGDERFELFATGHDGHLHRATASGAINAETRWSWSDSSERPGLPAQTTLIGTPAVSIAPTGYVTVFVRDDDGSLWVLQDDGHTSGGIWSSIGNERFIGDPVVGFDHDGMLEVFIMSALRECWRSYPHGGEDGGLASWSELSNLGAPVGNYLEGSTPALHEALSVTTNEDGHLDVFCSDGLDLWHTYEIVLAGAFYGWASWSVVDGSVLGTRRRGDPASVLNSDGRVEVFTSSASTRDASSGVEWKSQNHPNGQDGWHTNRDVDRFVHANT